MDLTNLSHDELAEGTRQYVLECERRLEEQNQTIALGLVKGAHAALEKAATRVANQGLITPMSGGDPK